LEAFNQKGQLHAIPEITFRNIAVEFDNTEGVDEIRWDTGCAALFD